MLTTVDILNHPKINTLVVIGTEECFFDAVDFFVGDDNDVEEVAVELVEKLNIRNTETQIQQYQQRAPGKITRYAHLVKHDVSRSKNESVPYHRFEKGGNQPDPMLPKVKLKMLMGVFALKADRLCRTSSFYHSEEKERPTTMAMRMV